VAGGGTAAAEVGTTGGADVTGAEVGSGATDVWAMSGGAWFGGASVAGVHPTMNSSPTAGPAILSPHAAILRTSSLLGVDDVTTE